LALWLCYPLKLPGTISVLCGNVEEEFNGKKKNVNTGGASPGGRGTDAAVNKMIHASRHEQLLILPK
jgi:hypothetical protein